MIRTLALQIFINSESTNSRSLKTRELVEIFLSKNSIFTTFSRSHQLLIFFLFEFRYEKEIESSADLWISLKWKYKKAKVT